MLVQDYYRTTMWHMAATENDILAQNITTISYTESTWTVIMSPSGSK